jgi:hypothetical protein
LLDEGFSIPGGVSTTFSLGTHTFFFFFVAGVVVDFGASLSDFSTFFLEGEGTAFGLTFVALELFYSGLLFFFLRPSTS